MSLAELFKTATIVKSRTDGVALGCCVVISGTTFPSERRIINVRQKPCSVRSERYAGTYVEFCRLPEKLGGSSNNNNNKAHQIPRHNTIPNT